MTVSRRFKHRVRTFETVSYSGIIINSRAAYQEALQCFKDYLNRQVLLKFGSYKNKIKLDHNIRYGKGRIMISDPNLFGPRGVFKPNDMIYLSIQPDGNEPVLLIEKAAR